MANRYADTAIIQQGTTGSLYYTNAIYPDIPPQNSDYYVITTMEDRLDLLAFSFYQDSSLWWVIASANALPGDSIYPPIGIQLRIPRDAQSVVSSYKAANV
jgi:hypothetical protein